MKQMNKGIKYEAVLQKAKYSMGGSGIVEAS
jgi:hypothetical protein